MNDLRVIDSIPPGEGVVAVLEDVLARARAGEISSVALAIVYRDGSTGDAWSDPPSVATLIGAATILQSRLVAVISTAEEA